MLEDIIVELKPNTTNPNATGYGVKSVRTAQCTLNDATIVIDGVTYNRTSPLRTARAPGGDGPDLDLVAAGDHNQPPVGSRASIGNALLAIFSESGT